MERGGALICCTLYGKQRERLFQLPVLACVDLIKKFLGYALLLRLRHGYLFMIEVIERSQIKEELSKGDLNGVAGYFAIISQANAPRFRSLMQELHKNLKKLMLLDKPMLRSD